MQGCIDLGENRAADRKDGVSLRRASARAALRPFVTFRTCCWISSRRKSTIPMRGLGGLGTSSEDVRLVAFLKSAGGDVP